MLFSERRTDEDCFRGNKAYTRICEYKSSLKEDIHDRAFFTPGCPYTTIRRASSAKEKRRCYDAYTQPRRIHSYLDTYVRT